MSFLCNSFNNQDKYSLARAKPLTPWQGSGGNPSVKIGPERIMEKRLFRQCFRRLTLIIIRLTLIIIWNEQRRFEWSVPLASGYGISRIALCTFFRVRGQGLSRRTAAGSVVRASSAAWRDGYMPYSSTYHSAPRIFRCPVYAAECNR